MISLLPIFLLLLLTLLNVPVAFGLLVSGTSFFLFVADGIPIELVFQRMVATAESFPLLAVPFFITAGVIMNYSGITSRLMSLAEVLTGHMVGGMAQVNILLSTLMGGASGSANADCAMQSKILVPEMVKRGYDKAFSGAVTAASSIITPIIPPGIALVLYGFLSGASVGRLFLAGYLPGLLLCAGFMITAHFISKRNNYAASRKKRAGFREIFRQTRTSVWAIFIPFGIILGLRFGLFTPTEAGAITVLYSIVIGAFIYRELKFKHFPRILLESVLSTAVVMFIIATAATFGHYLTWEGIPQAAASKLLDVTSNPMIMLMIINVFLLFVGMLVETTAVLMIVTPLLVPIILALGIDPVHFGIVMCVNLTIGGITPPFGILMFTTSSILNISILEYTKAALPFIMTAIVVLLVITYVPGVVLFLPRLIMP